MPKIKKIYIGTNLVRPKWMPGADTVAYYPLKSDVLDYSGNGNNGSGNPNSFTGEVANYSGNTTTLPYSIINRSIYTVNVWANSTLTKPSNDRCFLGQHSNSSRGFNLFYYNNANIQFRTGNNSGSVKDVGYNGSYTGWHLITAIVSGGTMYLYVDSVLISSTSSLSGDTHTLYMGYDKGYNGGAWSGKISELIVESKAWTASEIADYYTGTKSNYGL